jgi:hypothetical protein
MECIVFILYLSIKPSKGLFFKMYPMCECKEESGILSERVTAVDFSHVWGFPEDHHHFQGLADSFATSYLTHSQPQMSIYIDSVSLSQLQRKKTSSDAISVPSWWLTIIDQIASVDHLIQEHFDKNLLAWETTERERKLSKLQSSITRTHWVSFKSAHYPAIAVTWIVETEATKTARHNRKQT